MTLKIETFHRKQFDVSAVRVTSVNINEVAAWCDGEIQQASAEDATGRDVGDPYILVKVHNPLSPRQTKAFVGDWILNNGKGFKCYTDKSFRKTFDAKIRRPRQPLPEGLTATFVDDGSVGTENQLNNIFDAASSVTPSFSSGSTSHQSNPGGTTRVG